MKYLQVTVSTTSECGDTVAYLLSELGSDGASVKDHRDVLAVLGDKRNWDYADEALLAGDERVFVTGYFGTDFDLSRLDEALEGFRARCETPCGSLEVATKIIDSEDWENVWKKYYAPIVIGGVVVLPKWIDRPDDGLTRVLLDPGMAFGTGNHETTAMCIELMQMFALSGKTVFDVGCGSGILGITAAKLGANPCIMTDIDPQAVKAARANAALNGLAGEVTIYEGNLIDKVETRADVVIANITADVLISLCKDLRAAVKPGGKVIISGIIHARAAEVRAAYEKVFRLVRHIERGEWEAFAFEAPPNPERE